LTGIGLRGSVPSFQTAAGASVLAARRGLRRANASGTAVCCVSSVRAGCSNSCTVGVGGSLEGTFRVD